MSAIPAAATPTVKERNDSLVDSYNNSVGSSNLVLHRFLSLNDKSNTQTFTFVLPPKFTRGFITECCSKDFIYANQTFMVKLKYQTDLSNQPLGVYLHLKSASTSVIVQIDCSVTLISREHFKNNIVWQRNGVEFLGERTTTAGCHNFTSMDTVKNGTFLFDNWRALMEVELKHGVTKYCDEILPLRSNSTDKKSNNNNGKTVRNAMCVESAYFRFAACDWHVCVDGKTHKVTIFRNNRFDLLCRLRFRVFLKWEEREFDSGVVEQYLDASGTGKDLSMEEAFFTGGNMKKPLKILVDLMHFASVSLIDLQPTNKDSKFVRCYDAEQTEWHISSDILGSQVKILFSLRDFKDLPEHFSRHVVWSAALVPFDRSKPLVPATVSPQRAYFYPTAMEDFCEVTFPLPVAQVCTANAGYTHPTTGSLTVQIEWLHNHILSCNHYHVYDDIVQLHRLQLSEMVASLQSQNEHLTKQVNHQLQQQRRSNSQETSTSGTGTLSSEGPVSLSPTLMTNSPSCSPASPKPNTATGTPPNTASPQQRRSSRMLPTPVEPSTTTDNYPQKPKPSVSVTRCTSSPQTQSQSTQHKSAILKMQKSFDANAILGHAASSPVGTTSPSHHHSPHDKNSVSRSVVNLHLAPNTSVDTDNFPLIQPTKSIRRKSAHVTSYISAAAVQPISSDRREKWLQHAAANTKHAHGEAPRRSQDALMVPPFHDTSSPSIPVFQPPLNSPPDHTEWVMQNPLTKSANPPHSSSPRHRMYLRKEHSQQETHNIRRGSTLGTARLLPSPQLSLLNGPIISTGGNSVYATSPHDTRQFTLDSGLNSPSSYYTATSATRRRLSHSPCPARSPSDEAQQW